MKKNIAIITPYLNFPGGVEVYTKFLKSFLTENEYNVDIITTENDCNLPLYLQILKYFIGLPIITYYLYKRTKTKYDIVLCNGEFGFGINHKKCINIFHGCYIGYRNFLKKQLNFREYISLTKLAFIQKCAAKGKYIVTVSEFIKQILKKDGINVNKVILNAIDTDVFKPQELDKNNKFIFVGSYNYYGKGFDILEKLASRGFKIDCITNQNPGPLLNWIKPIKNDQLPKIYNKYLCMFFPSRFEGSGLTPLEAMSCGIPILMTEVGLGLNLKKIIPEFIISQNDENEYIRKWQIIKNKYQYFSKKARDYVKTYHNIHNYKNQWLVLIKDILND